MDNHEILKHIDHTLLKATSTWEQIQALCDEGVTYGVASVCIPPSFVKRVKEKYKERLNVCTVIGFPLGYSTTAVKVFEAAEAVKNGASEIDMVINIGALKEGNYDFVENEIAEVKKAVGNHILKVIVETCYLTDEEIARVSKLVTSAKGDYIKTSTGFGTSGAKMSNIKIFKENIGTDVKMKASGGVKSKEDLIDFISEGCDRIGTSSAVKLLNKDLGLD